MLWKSSGVTAFYLIFRGKKKRDNVSPQPGDGGTDIIKCNSPIQV